MAQSVQIVPKYAFPNVETIVNNNTIIDNSTTVAAEETPSKSYISVFASSKGIDNKLIDIGTINEYYKEFGPTNYKMYGQPGLMPEALLSNPNTKVWCMRVMPDDSTYANSVLSLWYKVVTEESEETTETDNQNQGSGTTEPTNTEPGEQEEEPGEGGDDSQQQVSGDEGENEGDSTPATGTRKLQVMFTTKSFTTPELPVNATEAQVTAYNNAVKVINDADNLVANAQLPDGTTSDGSFVADGWTQVPIAVFRSNGRGRYGNNLRWRISTNLDYEKEYGIKIYTFEVIDDSNGATTVARYVGSLVPSNKVSGTTFINDVIDDVDTTLPVSVRVFEENVELFYDVYKEFLDEENASEIPDIDVFDPFFALKLTTSRLRVGEADEYMEIINNGDPIVSGDITENPITLDDVVGNDILGGYDGSIDTIAPNGQKRTAEEIQDALDQLYIDAFSGKLDKTILSPRRIPSNALFDANYSPSVKTQLAKMALYRNDALTYFDAGLNVNIESSVDLDGLYGTFASIDALKDDELNGFGSLYNDYMFSYNFQRYLIKEQSTGRRIPVTITYFLAQTHPNHVEVYGTEIPMVNEYCELSGHIKNSLEPTVEMHESEIKEKLYENRLNYFESVAENRFRRATQNTSVDLESDLMEESNVQTLYELKRSIEDDANSNHYKFTSADDRASFTEFIKAKYASWVGNKVLSLNVKYDMTEWEFERSIVHVYLDIVFRQLTKRSIVELDINKRTYDSIG